MYMLEPMPKQAYTATEAARELGISVDTLRRWDRDGRIRTKRDSANRRLVTLKEIERLRGSRGGRDPRCGRRARTQAGNDGDRRCQVDVGDGGGMRLRTLAAAVAVLLVA